MKVLLNAVEVEEVQELRPKSNGAEVVMVDVFGNPIVYEKTVTQVIVPVAGRVKSKADAETLALACLSGESITLTERDGVVTTGWTIQKEPAPTIRRKDGDSADWQVDLRLWRLP